jgi:hypothetical protein
MSNQGIPATIKITKNMLYLISLKMTLLALKKTILIYDLCMTLKGAKLPML